MGQVELTSTVVRAIDIVTVSSSGDLDTTFDVSSNSGIDVAVGGPGLGYQEEIVAGARTLGKGVSNSSN